MSQYKPAFPSGVQIHPAIGPFFTKFFEVSDTPGLTEQYVNLFTKDATFIMASKYSIGSDEITATRNGMWTLVESRKHTLHKIFPFGENATEVMMYGTVELGLRSGSTANVDWAARAQLTEDESDGQWKMSYYQVYLDTGAMKK